MIATIKEETVSVRSIPVAVQSSTREGSGARWFYAYLVAQIGCQLLLLVPSLGPARLFFRTAAFATSLAFLALAPGRASGFSLQRTLLAVGLVVMALGALNAEGGGVVASAAHWTFHLAIVAPAFWGSRLRIDQRALERILILLWAFSTASAVTGVLQATFPGQFQPPLSVVLAERGPDYVAAMSIRLTSGEWIVRPMGLTDVPGGAASGGLYAILLGIGIVQARPFRGARLLGAAGMVAGLVCLYLSQIRALIVMLAICVLALLVVLAYANRLGRVLSVLTIGGVLASVGFAIAVAIGGSSVTDRLNTLTQESPAAVYYKNRGIFLEHTFLELLSQYPLGAGLGRWGMMNRYFGERGQSIWVEIQWTGWLLDGGILLLALYPLAVFVTIVNAAQLSRRDAGSTLGIWAALVAAYDVGTMALTFSFPIFMSTGGLEFWLLNAALLRAGSSAAQSHARAR